MFREVSRKSQMSRSRRGQGDGYQRPDISYPVARSMPARRDLDKELLDSVSDGSLPRISKDSQSIIVVQGR
jgi:hypothetical protein